LQPAAQRRHGAGAIGGARHVVLRIERVREAFGDERIVVDEKQARLLHATIIGEV